MMLKLRILLFFPFILHAAFLDWFDSSSDKAKRAKDLLETFDPIVQKAVEDYQVPGIAVGVVVDGQVVYLKGFGYRDLEKKLPVTTDTQFAAGSCTKAFTAFVMGTLVDSGSIEWDQPVIDVLPDFRLWDQYANQNLTIRDLLTHRSGLPRHDFMCYNSPLSREELMRRIRYLEPSSGLRERYQYNNLMYLTAGCAMERVTGKTWEELVTERIFKPLGMKNCNFSIVDMQKSDNFSYPYMERNDKLKRIPFHNVTAMGPAGSINASVKELIPWLRLHLNNGVSDKQALISPATLQEMHAPQVIVPGAPESLETLLHAYGMGWSVLSYRGRYYVSHDGGIDGFTSVIGFLPNEKVGIIILSNTNLTPLPRFLSFEILDRVLELPHIGWLKDGLEIVRKGKDAVKEKMNKENLSRKKGTSPSHPLDEFVGEYEHPGYGTVYLDQLDGKLRATFNGIGSTLDHWHYDVFVLSEEAQDRIVSLEGTKFTFRSNLSGDIDELAIPFEPRIPDIVFKKKPSNKLSATTYLKQFVGPYVIYGYTVEIVLKESTLCAVIPGQPLYELIPNTENEFNVKEMTGSTVRFVLDAMNRVQEVILIHPYGAFTAKPKS